jgi:hypothetical protein
MRLILWVGLWLSSLAGTKHNHGSQLVHLQLTTVHRNYDHVASLWKHEKWLPDAAVTLARSHYSAYMVKRVDGLRVISLNTDMCSCSNLNAERHTH